LLIATSLIADAEVSRGVSVVEASVLGRTANRRDRAVYNEYMKSKMREYRAKKKSAPKPL
jgi:hypothetical protein